MKGQKPRLSPRFTIERLRTVVLIGGGLLVLAIAAFLGFGQWKLRKAIQDIPKHLGVDIQQQADGVNYTQSRKGKTLFKIHAARAVQMKSNGKTLLHDVKIDLYGEDGQRSDTISGSEFEYDPGAGLAQAAGAVEITMMRPGVKPAIAQLKPGASKQPLVAGAITDSEIHVRTSGLSFDQKNGVATTSQRVDFALKQGNGSSMGATYVSAQGQLILDREVELHVDRSVVSHDAAQGGGRVTIHASHADFERNEQQCQLTQALAEYSGGTVETGNALIHFRDDGSVEKLDGSNGVDLKTRSGNHVTAPMGTVDFDEQNHPHKGLLTGGTRLESTQTNREVTATSPTARLAFDSAGQLHQAHLEQGVAFNLDQTVTTAKGVPAQQHRNWKSQTADIAFAPVQRLGGSNGESRVEPRTIHGSGGVVITSETTSAGVVSPSKLAADSVVAELAPGSVLSTLSGTGHASFEQRTAAGVQQSSASDQLDVRFTTPAKTGFPKSKGAGDGAEIASMVQTGHVVMVQDAPARRSGQTGRAGQIGEVSDAPASSVRATASRAEYEGSSEVLHLSGSPRFQDGELDLTANLIDFSKASGDALAHGDVKASWTGSGTQSTGQGSAARGFGLLGGGGTGSTNAGENGPIHAIAAEAELRQASEEVVFRSARIGTPGAAKNQARLWQGANSVSATLITLNRQKQTLTAQSSNAAAPVRTVLLSNPSPKEGKSKRDTPSILRLTSGELHYSEAQRLATFSSGAVGSVTAQTTDTGGAATVVSQSAEVRLLPVGVHPLPKGEVAGSSVSSSSNSSVDRMTARGHVTVDWPGRKGTGEKLVYQGDDGTFTLTGTGAAPPRITDQIRGNVTGSALIFHSRDDSVTVEGDGGKTVTETQSPKKQPK